MIDYEKELNESQLAAVQYCDGPSLVIAGAGSGKTRVLTFKIAWLLEHGYEPWSIMALTFTNKAAREMQERIARQVGEEQASPLWMGTFHSIFAKFLRREHDVVGFSQHFTIYDQSDSRSLVKTIIKEMGLDEKVYKPNAVHARISDAKNRLLTPSLYGASAQDYEEDQWRRIPQTRDIYARYQERLRLSDAMDFDDLLMLTYYLFRDHPEVLDRYRRRFRYLLVDEYQDTNLAQHQIVWQLTGEHQHVCVVGDDSQSIYSFRGANIDNILGFQQRYTDVRLFKLEQNYRSTQTIVKAANSVIEHNVRRIPKEVYSYKEEGGKITVFEAVSDKEEAGYVTRQVLSLTRRQGLSLSDIAILYRTNGQSRLFEETLRKAGIFYRIYGGLSFYQRKEIKDIMAYFRLIANPHDEEAFKRVVNYPSRGIGDTTVRRLMEGATSSGVSPWTLLENPAQYDSELKGAPLSKLQQFCAMIAHFQSLAATDDAYEVAKAVLDQSGVRQDIFADSSDEGRSRQENVQELMDGIADFVHSSREEGREAVALVDYLADVSLLTDQDNPHGDDAPHVTLMTVHSAKGLEFNTVFIVGMEENLFPNEMCGDEPGSVEEERRLFYVALTRAEERCFLTYAKSRFRFGSMEFGSRSRFIAEIDETYLASGNTSAARPAPDYPSRSYVSGSRYGSYGSERRYGSGSSGSSYGSSKSSSGGPSSYGNPSASSAAGSRRLVSMRTGTAMPASSNGEGGGAASLHAGQHVEHERFGRGVVLSVSGEAENRRAVVRFDNAGEKTLLLKFARFKVQD